MVKLIIDNSYSKIEGLKPKHFNTLRKLLSYTDPSQVYYSGGFVAPTYLMDKKGFFPTGLISRVARFAYAVSGVEAVVDIRKVPAKVPNFPKINLSGIKPYSDQLLAASVARTYGRGGISYPTGAGKSLIIGLIIDKLKVKTLIVVPSLELKAQLTASLTEWFGKTDLIRVENIDSKALHSLATGFDCLIIDEGHHAAAKTYRRLNRGPWKGIYHRFCLTATFFRNQDHEQLPFEGIAGDLIYKLSIKDAIAKGYIAPVEAYYFDLPKRTVLGHSWKEVYKEMVTDYGYRNQIIASTLLRLNRLEKSTLCLVKEINHGNQLSELTGLPFANGQDESSRDYIRQFNRGEIKALIGTVGVLAEGVDTKPAEYVIACGLGKAKSSFMQLVGRVMRTYLNKESGKIIFFRDRSHKWCLSHYRTQRRILIDEYGVTPIKLDL